MTPRPAVAPVFDVPACDTVHMAARTGLLRCTIGAMALLMASGCGNGESPSDSPTDTATAITTTPVDDESFTDPQGSYTITIDGNWSVLPGTFVREIEAWAVAAPVEGFTSNLNVLTQDTLGADLDEYLTLSVENLGGLELIDVTTVTGVKGNELGLLEYSGVLPGAPSDQPLHFLATVDVRDGVAVVATLTTTPEAFARLRPEIEPFLLTLQAT